MTCLRWLLGGCCAFFLVFAANPARAQKDVGVFDGLNDAVKMRVPSWLNAAQWPSKGSDLDGDGIANQQDVLRGAKKADLNDAAYGSPYRILDFPNGDVPRNEGVCTDVVIRSLRNAGYDLQKEVWLDIRRRPKAYPMVKRANRNIDHRRVKTLLPFFKKHAQALPTRFEGNEASWLPGDLVLMQTMGDARPDHIGVVSDRLGPSGKPLIINNWTHGYKTDALDLLDFVPVTHHVRPHFVSRKAVGFRGLAGVLQQAGVTLPQTGQLVVVTANSAGATTAELRLLTKKGAGWKVEHGPVAVALGRSGLRPGRGIAGTGSRVGRKREGDGASPSGVFKLGHAFGTSERPAGYRGAYRQVGAEDRWVDDPTSQHYNRWVDGTTPKDWVSAEDLRQYDLAVVIEHNFKTPRPRHGSAIFLHTWEDLGTPTSGCTALSKADLLALLGKLDPHKNPVLLQAVADWRP